MSTWIAHLSRIKERITQVRNALAHETLSEDARRELEDEVQLLEDEYADLSFACEAIEDVGWDC